MNLLLALAVLAGAAPPQVAPSPSPSPEPSPAPSRFNEVVEVVGELPAVPAYNLTAMKSPVGVLSTPASVAVVPRTLFASQQAQILSDALLNASGVNVASNFGVHDYFTIRGFDSLSSGLVLTDGASEPEATYYPLYNVRQVEVLKGPAAFLYGGNPLSGAVHLVRKQPQSGRFAEASVSWGRFGTLEGTLDANLARADGRWALRVNGLYRTSDSYRDGRANDLRAVNPVLTWRPDDHTRLTANLEYVRSEFAPDAGLPLLGDAIAPVPRTRSYQSPLDASDQDIVRIRVDAERGLGSRLSVRGKLYCTDLDWRSHGTILLGAFPGATGALEIARTFPQLDDHQRWLGAQAEALARFETGSWAHDVVAGVEAARQTDDFTLDIALLPNIALLDPVETAREPLFVIPGLSTAGDARSIVLAPYLVDHVTRGRVQLFLGGRLDRIDYEDRATSTQRNDTQLSPLAGLVLSAGPGLSLYANAGAAFAPPSTQVRGPREPEKSRQAEAGAKKEMLAGKLLATVALYHLEKDNVAIPDATGALRQTGDQRSRGLEVELQGEPAAGWFASAAYAWSDPELVQFTQFVQVGFDSFALADRSGNRPAFAPRHLLSTWIMKQLRGGIGLAGGARYVGPQFIAEDNAFAIDGYWTADAAVSYRHGRFKASLNGKNLTGREYETRGFGSASVIPANPRALYARIEVGLGRGTR